MWFTTLRVIFKVGVKSMQHLDPLLMELKETVLSKSNKSFYQGENWVLTNQGRLFIPDVDGLRKLIMQEAHVFRYSIQLGDTKMYHDL